MLNVIESAPKLIKSDRLAAACQRAHFAPGDVLREAGLHYRGMYLITEGSVEIVLPARQATTHRTLGPGASIGEIGFLRGCPATGTVTARTAVDALVIDDAALARLETEDPVLTAQLMRHLALTAEERAGPNLLFAAARTDYTRGGCIDVHLCRNREMLESAQQLRYEVYCGELGRESAYADHQRKTIADDLDSFGHTFIAVEAGETIGTMRANLSLEGPLGMLEELYRMRTSAHHPAATAVCTKFIVRKDKRRGPAAIKLISAMARYGVRQNIRECFLDCIPALLPYYRALGCRIAGQEFLHRENGASIPLVVDLARYGAKWSRDYGARQYLVLYAYSKAIKWTSRVRRSIGIR